jgi:hypothetical protein
VIILNDNLQKLEAALNSEITDDEGQQIEENAPSFEESAPQEEKQMGESTETEKSTEEEVKESKPGTESEEMQPVEDEEGKKYIPEKRFKEVYAKSKENERRVKELEKAVAQQYSLKPQEQAPHNKTDDLEVELLFAKYPQFDPEHENYDVDVDDLAADIFLAGKAKTKIEAAKMALDKVKKLSSKSIPIKDEARVIKKAMSESVTTKGGSRVEVEPDPDKMSPEEMESYMKAKGEWL